MKLPPPPKFYEVLNKQLPMSFSSYLSNPDGSRYCVKPFVSHLRHYQNPDMPLGAFLETYCFDRSYNHPLPSSQSHQDIGGLSNMSSNASLKPSNNNAYCPIPITDHGRRFCLGNTSVSLVIQTLEKPINSKNGEHILIWKYCPMCKATTELMPLSFEAQMMSYAMFLLILVSSYLYFLKWDSIRIWNLPFSDL